MFQLVIIKLFVTSFLTILLIFYFLFSLLISEAVRTFQLAVDMNMEHNRFSTAAKLWKGKIYKKK